MILILRWQCSKDVLLVLFNVSRLVQLGVDFLFVQRLRFPFRPVPPMLPIYVEQRTMEADVLVGFWVFDPANLGLLALSVSKDFDSLTGRPPLQPL
jgi:hypothetical protein